jgi:DNA-directed RNA polymerase II subunit RPB2
MNEKGTMKTENVWKIIKSYFKGRYLERLVRHQLESYNNFINVQLQQTIDMFNPVTIHSDQDYDENSKLYRLEILITFNNFQIYRPQIHENNGATKIMFPQEARLRNFTYSSPMTVDLNIKIINRTGENLQSIETIYKKMPRVHIGKLPIMLKSNICVLKQNSHLDHRITGECSYDPGGYFIINGSEKTVIAQERAAENRIMCFDTRKGNSKWSWQAEIKSIPDFKCISPKQINMTIMTRNNGFGHPIYVTLPRIKKANTIIYII